MNDISIRNKDETISSKKAAAKAQTQEHIGLNYNDMKCIRTLKGIIEVTMYAYDLKLALSCNLLLANINRFAGNHKQCQNSLKAVRNFASELKDFDIKMRCYDLLGQSYLESKDYSSAVKSFKKLMQLAWREKCKKTEIKAYEGLQNTYYYLGELDKCQFLIQRIYHGLYERDDSKIKELVLNKLQYAQRDFDRHHF